MPNLLYVTVREPCQDQDQLDVSLSSIPLDLQPGPHLPLHTYTHGHSLPSKYLFPVIIGLPLACPPVAHNIIMVLANFFP